MTTTTLTSLSIPKVNAGATGDIFLLADGTYDHISDETISKAGVTLKAANKGKAIIRGQSINLSGVGAAIQDLTLEYKVDSQTVVDISGANAQFTGNTCRFKGATTARNDWFVIKGDGVKFDGNDLGEKVGLGHMIYLPSSSSKPIVKDVKITNNYLHDQSTGGTTSETNGFEMIMVGYSGAKELEFNCEIANNKIENYTAPDAELFTIKCSGNNIHHNEFIGGKASVTFRHGRKNKFNNNKVTGSGLRVYGRDHEVIGNTFRKNPLSGKQIIIGNGSYAEEEQNTTAGYTQVRGLIFKDNYIDNEDAYSGTIFNFGSGSGSLKPVSNQIIGNTITASKGTLANTNDGASWSNNTVQNNILWCSGTAQYGNMPTSGYTKKDPNVVAPPPPPPPEPTPVLSLESLDARLKIIEARLGL